MHGTPRCLAPCRCGAVTRNRGNRIQLYGATRSNGGHPSRALRATGVCVGGGTGGSGSATACRPCQLIYLLDATPSIAPRPQLLHHPLRWEPARHPSGEVAPPRPLNEMARKGGFVFAIVADPPRGGTLIQRASIGE